MAPAPRLLPDVLKRLAAIALLAAALAGCAPLIGEYSVEAYKNATSLKAETMALMDRSGEPFTTRRREVEALTTKINAAYEYSAGLPGNQLSAQQWQILRDPNGNLYGSFVRRWQSSGTLSAGYRSEKRTDVAEAFDFIICLEANKRDFSPCSRRERPAGGGASR